MKQATLREIFRLSVAQRIQLAQEILESVTAEQYLPKKDKLMLDRRLELIEKYPERGATWKQIKKRLNQSHA